MAAAGSSFCDLLLDLGAELVYVKRNSTPLLSYYPKLSKFTRPKLKVKNFFKIIIIGLSGATN